MKAKRRLRWTLDRRQLQHDLLLQLANRMLSKATKQCSGPVGRLALSNVSVTYPWRLFDMLISLAQSRWGPLQYAGENLHQTLIVARSHATEPQVTLRAPYWLHTRLLLAAIGELERHCRRLTSCEISEEQIQQIRKTIPICQTDIGSSLTQLADSGDQSPVDQSTAELLHAIGTFYFENGVNA